MITFSVYYPKTEGASFDHDYYVATHVPLACEVGGLDPAKARIERGLDGPYEAAVHFSFDSTDEMGAALGAERTGEVMADVANYTTIAPVTQTSQVVG